MRKFLPALFAASAALALTACGSATDASEDALADNVEMPADEAMSDAPDPVMDENATMDSEEVEMDAMEAAETAEGMVDNGVEDAIGDAEASME